MRPAGHRHTAEATVAMCSPPNHHAVTAVMREFASVATYAGAMCPGMRPLAASGFFIGTVTR